MWKLVEGSRSDDHPPTQEAAKMPGPLPPSAPDWAALCCFCAKLQPQESLTRCLGWQLVRRPAPSPSLGSWISRPPCSATRASTALKPKESSLLPQPGRISSRPWGLSQRLALPRSVHS